MLNEIQPPIFSPNKISMLKITLTRKYLIDGEAYHSLTYSWSFTLHITYPKEHAQYASMSSYVPLTTMYVKNYSSLTCMPASLPFLSYCVLLIPYFPSGLQSSSIFSRATFSLCDKLQRNLFSLRPRYQHLPLFSF